MWGLPASGAVSWKPFTSSLWFLASHPTSPFLSFPCQDSMGHLCSLDAVAQPVCNPGRSPGNAKIILFTHLLDHRVILYFFRLKQNFSIEA